MTDKPKIERTAWKVEHDRVKAELEQRIEELCESLEAARLECDAAQEALSEEQSRRVDAENALKLLERDVRRARLEGASAVANALLELE